MTEMTEAEAAAERAAIAAELAARNVPDEKTNPDFKPTAEAARAGRARRLAGPVELAELPVTRPARKLDSRSLLERDYTRLERAQLAAEMKRMERAAKRAEAKRAARAASFVSALGTIRAELPNQYAELAEAAGVSAEVQYAEQLAEAAEVLGVDTAEAAEVVAAARDYHEYPVTVRGTAVELAEPIADREAAREAAEAARAARAAAEAARPSLDTMAASPAAEAAREALAAIGPRAAGLVVTRFGSDTVTVCRSVRVPAAGVAARRAEVTAAELAAATAKLAAAELAVTAARGRKAKRPIDAAEADANRYAAAVAKLAKRAELAAKLADVAEQIEGLGLAELEAYVAEPVAELKLARAAEAAEVTLRIRADVMPIQCREVGPSVKAARLVSGRGHLTMAANGAHVDPTGDSAAELASGYRGKLAAAEAAEAEYMAKLAEADAAERAAAREARRLAYKEREAARKRAARAVKSGEAAAAAKMSAHGRARAAKRAAR